MAEQVAREPAGSVATTGRSFRPRRRHPRVPVAGRVRLVADSGDGLVTMTGHVIDLSVSGCAIRVHTPLEHDREARLELQLGRERVWVPGRVVWTRRRERAWIAGVRFDRVAPLKQSLLVRLVAERRRHASD